jgi:hypothetical protein
MTLSCIEQASESRFSFAPAAESHPGFFRDG